MTRVALAAALLVTSLATGLAHAIPWYGVRSPLASSDTIQNTDRSGASVAISGETAIVGAPLTTVSGKAGAGAARVFLRSGGTFTQQAKLEPADAMEGATFGTAVAISGNTAIVGAPLDSTKAGGAGAAYVYVRSGTTWTQQAKLYAATPLANAVFGFSVAIEGDTALIGAYQTDIGTTARVGAVHVLVRSGTTWTEQAKLVPPSGDVDDVYGWHVALHGNTAVVGCVKDDDKGTDAGAAYVYLRTGSTWALQAKLLAGDGAAGDHFGISVAVNKDTAVVGARYHDPKGASDAGAAYVFFRSGSSWSQQAKLVSGAAGDRLGSSVALENDVAIVGAPLADPSGMNSGRAVLFARTGTTWTEAASLDYSPLSAGGFELGTSVALAGDTVITGAPGATSTGNPSAYAFRVAARKTNGSPCACPTGAATCDRAECENGFCADGVCCSTNCAGECNACTRALKGSGEDGVCEPVAADTDPRMRCATGTTACGADGLCNGAGACRMFAKPSTSCGTTTCAAGVVTGNLCNGTGTCTPSMSSCGAYACSASACNTTCTSDIECASDSFCTSTGACAKKKGNGSTCGAAKECATGFCIDGVCCDTTCTGQCEACAIPGTEGTCVAVLGAPRFDRAPCGSDGTSCSGTCDGVNRPACVYPQSTVACGSSCIDGKETRRSCDGKGGCAESGSNLCGAFLCDPVAGKCREACKVDEECATAYRCDGGVCKPRIEATCSPDKRSSVRVDGTTDCGRFLCEESTGTCRKTCVATNECAPGLVCDSTSNDCVGGPAEGGDDGGCALGNARKGSMLAIAMITLLGLLRRRRARRSSDAC